MNLIATFIAQAARRPQQIAIIDRAGRSATYDDLAWRSAALAGAWRARGLTAGDRVVLAMGLGIDLYVALAAAWRIGAVVVFPEPAMGLPALRHAVRVSRPHAFLAAGWYRTLGWALPELRRVALTLTPHDGGNTDEPTTDVGDDHPALISFTSGSTGAPKAIVRSHGFLAAQNACVATLLSPPEQDAIDLVAFPVFVIANLGLGVTSVLPNWNLRRHDTADPAAIVAHMSRHGVTRALLPPSVCARLCDATHLPPLAAIFTGGGPVMPNLLERLRERLPNADIVAVYGSTEAEPIAHLHARDITPADMQAMRNGGGLLTGRPIPEIKVRLIDDEIVVTGAHVNKGYLDPAQDAANKPRIDGAVWHRTGDAGRIDDQGRLWLLGRHEARIGTLYPFAVEVAASGWPGVRQAALTAINGRAVLAIAGNVADQGNWNTGAAKMGDIRVVHVDAVPLDRRHRSKVDYAALRKLLSAPL